MIKVQFTINDETIVEMWDVSGLSMDYINANLVAAVKSDNPDATDIKIIEAFVSI